VAPEVLGDAATGDQANSRADHLSNRHQGIAEQHHPGQRVAELRTHLIPLGSSSAAPVTRPGPSTFRKFRAGSCCAASVRFAPEDLFI
jgi:hypothetical protein